MCAPHRYASSVLPSQVIEERTDRRLSDLLPTEIIQQIGYIPDQLPFQPTFSHISRRATDTVAMFPDFPPSTDDIQGDFGSLKSPFHPSPLDSDSMDRFTFFIIELRDREVQAFCHNHRSRNIRDGVIVSDPPFLRYGHVIREMNSDDCREDALPIVGVDPDSELCDYLEGQDRIASAVLPTFARASGCHMKILSIETVSYQSRALLRIRLSNTADPGIDKFLRKVFSLFSTAVEIYE